MIYGVNINLPGITIEKPHHCTYMTIESAQKHMFKMNDEHIKKSINYKKIQDIIDTNDRNNEINYGFYDPVEFHQMQFIVRYHICNGHYDTARMLIQEATHNGEYLDFIHYKHLFFMNQTIFQQAMRWSTNKDFIAYLIDIGSDINSRNMFGQLPEEAIENTVWVDPFGCFEPVEPYYERGVRAIFYLKHDADAAPTHRNINEFMDTVNLVKSRRNGM